MLKRKFLRQSLVAMLVFAQVFSPLVSQAAVSTIVHTSESDFSLGTYDGGISVSDNSGNIQIEQKQPSYIETTLEDFSDGDLSGYSGIEENDDGEIALDVNNPMYYTTTSTPNIPNAGVNDIRLDTRFNLVYISTQSGGVSVMDTKGTILTSDDELLITFTTTSTPAIVSNVIRAIDLNTTDNLIYISTQSGLSVINTQDGIPSSDDPLVITYNMTSSPALPVPSNNVDDAFFDASHNMLYVLAGGYLVAINTNGTIPAGDDVIVKILNTTSTPALPSSGNSEIYFDEVDNLLYVSSYIAGLTVIDTQDGILSTDDPVLITYSSTSTPALAGDTVRDFSLPAGDLLYIAAEEGLTVIDTQGTKPLIDDVLIFTYSPTSTPAVPEYINGVYINTENDLIYIAHANSGVSIINTNGTESVSDDEFIGSYKSGTDPGLPFGSSIAEITYDTVNDLLYICLNNTGVYIINTVDSLYFFNGYYLSNIIDITSVDWKSFSWEGQEDAGHTISFQTRTGLTEIWRDEMTTDALYAGDYWLWLNAFLTVEETGSTVKLSNAEADPDDIYFWFDTAMPAGYFPVGSTITARIRINSNTRVSTSLDSMFSDEWNGDYWEGALNNNEWTIVSYTETVTPFSTIGFDLYSEAGTWDNDNDSFEIDWIQITTSPAWGDWSTECTDSQGCPILTTVGDNAFQYRVNFTTDNTYTTPLVESVTLEQGYQSTGTYTSPVLNSGSSTTIWTDLTADVTLPEGTSATFYTRTGNTSTPDVTWSSWQAVNSPIASPVGQYLQYQIVLGTEDELRTPYIELLEITFDPDGGRLTQTGDSIIVFSGLSMALIIPGIVIIIRKVKRKGLGQQN